MDLQSAMERTRDNYRRGMLMREDVSSETLDILLAHARPDDDAGFIAWAHESAIAWVTEPAR